MNTSNEEIVASPPQKKAKLRSEMESPFKTGVMEVPVNECAIEIERDEELSEFQVSLVDVKEFSSQNSISQHQFATSMHVTDSETSSYLQESSLSLTQTEDNQLKWRGKPLCEIRYFVSENNECPTICDSATHTVLFKTPYTVGTIPVPHPPIYEDKWDSSHVKMPCSDSNLYPVHNEGKSSLRKRWKLIQEAYSKSINTSLELEKAILCYNTRYNDIWDFQQFHKFIDEVLPTCESEHFFKKTLPGIISLAISVTQTVTRPPVLLVRQQEHSISLSQVQIAALLANAFLCTFPRRNTQKKLSEYSSYPDINFIRLFENKSKSNWIQEKLKCLFHYFDRVSEKEPSGVVTFTRKVISEADLPNWESVEENFNGFHVSSEGTIEREGVGLLQMDFANRYIGGGVLGWGCVQEEIRFIICPELIAACLLTEVLEKNEAIVITGVEQYCRYSGYSNTFRFEGDFVDTTPRDNFGRRLCKLVAIDAVKFRKKEIQYKKDLLTRELNKAFVGYHCPQSDMLVAVAGGNWGCGAYRGDPRLKCLLQLMAASLARRDLLYFTFGDEPLRDEVFQMYSTLTDKHVTIGSLYQILCQYGQLYGQSDSPSLDIYGYIYAILDTLDSDGGDMDLSSNPSDEKME